MESEMNISVHSVALLLMLLLAGCNSAERVESWRPSFQSGDPTRTGDIAGKLHFIELGYSFGGKEYDMGGVFAEGLGPVTKNGKWGYINRNVELIIPLKYEDAGYFYDGIASVKIHGKWGFINRHGEFVIEPMYDEIYYGYTLGLYNPYFGDAGLLGVKMNGKCGFIDRTGHLVVEPQYEDISGAYQIRSYCAGIMQCNVKLNHKWGRIDKYGKFIIPPIFDDPLIDMYEYAGFIPCKINGKWGLYDLALNSMIIDAQYNSENDIPVTFNVLARLLSRNNYEEWSDPLNDR